MMEGYIPLETAARQIRGNGGDTAPAAAPAKPATTDTAFGEDALALEFSERHGDDWRYVAGWNRWMQFDGGRWHTEETHRAFDLARKVCRDAAASEDKKTAAALSKAAVVAGVERLAKADRRHAATVDQWDGDIWTLNTPDFTLDLRTDEGRPHTRGDYLTKMTGAAPGGDCEMWRSFLDEITNGDGDLQAFLQRMCGYALTGSTREHSLFFLHGHGGNGKSVFLNTIAGVAGDYAATAPMETFIVSRNDRHPTELAGLRAARLVTATETQEGRRWDEAKIKTLTGGDAVAARFMRQDFFRFTPQFKLLIAGNHRPSLRNVDEAFRRRFFLLPFTVTIPREDRDLRLTEKLKTEWPGIARWMIAGTQMWLKDGLNPPPIVVAATEAYLAVEDVLQQWIEEKCEPAPGVVTPSHDLYRAWKSWCEAGNEYAGKAKGFTMNLTARDGLERGRTNTGAKGVSGLRLKPSPDLWHEEEGTP